MKFNCGPTIEERRRRRMQAARDYWCVWQRWFAWYPVRIGANDCRWLEFVERKFDRVSVFDGEPKEPSYRPLTN